MYEIGQDVFSHVTPANLRPRPKRGKVIKVTPNGTTRVRYEDGTEEAFSKHGAALGGVSNRQLCPHMEHYHAMVASDAKRHALTTAVNMIESVNSSSLRIMSFAKAADELETLVKALQSKIDVLKSGES